MMLGSSVTLVVGTAVHAQASGRASADTAFAVSRNGVIDISMRSANLVVRGSDRTTAELRSKNRDYQMRSSGVSVTLSVGDRDDRSTRSSQDRAERNADVLLMVPNGVRLVIHSTSGDVDISNVTGDVDIDLRSGDVHTRALGGRAIIQTLSGDITMTEGVGDLRITTVSGDITARQVRGTIDIGTTSGTVLVTADRSSRAQIDGVSGDVHLDGTFASDARMQITTHSGDVSLRLPESAGGNAEVTTFSGDLHAGALTLLPFTDAGGSRRSTERRTRRFEFGGGGAAHLVISTFSGDVTIARGVRRGGEEE